MGLIHVPVGRKIFKACKGDVATLWQDESIVKAYLGEEGKALSCDSVYTPINKLKREKRYAT